MLLKKISDFAYKRWHFIIAWKEVVLLKRSKDWNKEKFEKWINQGRGTGELANYKPFLTIYDIPSKGRATRTFGWKTGRIHHFFSDIQLRYFYLLEWEDNVIDIREHYPLLDLRDVIEDDDLNLEKYKSDDGTDYIFTTTFLIKIKDNNKDTYIARSVKVASELEKKSTIERLEIERRYWRKKGIDWGIVTNKEISVTKAKNIEYILSALELDNNEIFEENEKYSLSKMLESKLNRNSKAIREIVNDFDLEYNLQQGTGLLIFKYLLAKKRIKTDIDSKIDINASAMSSIKFNNIGGEAERYVSNS